jgi:sec-independent protein translocase protein TatB
VFNVSGTEIMVILLVALVVLGPDKLPDAIRRVGRVYGELRRMSNGFQSELRDAFDEPIREMRSTMDVARNGFLEPMDDDGSAAPTAGATATAPAPADSGATNGTEAAGAAPVEDLRAGDMPDDPLKMKWPPTPPATETADAPAAVDALEAVAVGAPAEATSADPAHALEVGDEELRPFEGVFGEEEPAPPAPTAADEAEHPAP